MSIGTAKPFSLFLALAGLSWLGAWAQTSPSLQAIKGSPVADLSLLWQLGASDSTGSGAFALGPDQWKNWSKDGYYIVGRSRTKNDWPYCQPGPFDAWAGSRQHTFAIVFAVKGKPEGDCRLAFQLEDVGDYQVKLNIDVNGHSFKQTLSPGAGTGIRGEIPSGEKRAFRVDIPSGVLRVGTNKVSITTEEGSWFVYNWLGFYGPTAARLKPVPTGISLGLVTALPFLSTRDGISFQTVEAALDNTGDSTEVEVRIPGMEPQTRAVAQGSQSIQVLVPTVTHDTSLSITIIQGGQVVDTKVLPLQPVAPMTIYILPHSHNDIGYTEIQTSVEKKQMNNLLKGMEYARKTKDYPEGSRFVWNLEGVYAADLFLHRMDDQQKKDFYEAVTNGQVALNGMYVNTLTGLCRPEELLQLFRFSTELAQQCHVKVDAAMISDVPGYTWGTVTAMAQAGIRYFSAAPNNFDRIGDILEQWEDKPFYWMSPSGKEKVLVWIPYRGYALSHGVPRLSDDFVSFYMNKLNSIHYPYGISYIRWSGHGDNAVPEIEICDFVKDWNARYTSPHFIISSTSTAFSAFEQKYGSQLPVEKGDWTGYWEDGAASSAFETAQNRASTERLTQAETMWAIEGKEGYPAATFQDAWQHAILYSEHTWGADMSVTNPLAQKTIEQWAIKKSYATIASDLSKALLDSATVSASVTYPAIDVFNTNSWKRSGLVLVSREMSPGAILISDDSGRYVPAQVLSTGQLAFVARDIPPFAARRFYLRTDQQPARRRPANPSTAAHLRALAPASTRPRGSVPPAGADSAPVSPAADGSEPLSLVVARAAGYPVSIGASGNTLDNGLVSVSIDPETGAIKSLRAAAISNNFVDSAAGNYINDYLFLNGNNVANVKRNGPVKIWVKEQGPVLATLRIESDAPGCNKLTREVSLIRGGDFVTMTDILDKKAAELNPHPGDYAWANTGGKESVNFGFPFHVTGGSVLLDIPMGIMRPDTDQIPGSCKNWLEVEQWADVSNKHLGVTWVTLDAPLVEVGGITANLLGGQTNPAVWRKTIGPTQKLYSWALNNHWETNYRASQEGIITLRYAVKPHGVFDPVASTRFATGLAQPLIAIKAVGQIKNIPQWQLTDTSIVALVFKPSDDGKAFIVTLYNPTGKTHTTGINWSVPVKSISYSNTSEAALDPATKDITIAAQDVVTLRIEK